MTTRDYEGHPIRLRSRQFYATVVDVLNFLNLIIENVSEARLYDVETIEDGKFPETSPAEWVALEKPADHEISILFHDGSWEPKFETWSKEFPESLRLANLPSPSVSVYSGIGIGSKYIEQIDRTIRRSAQGVIHSNDRIEDERGKKTIDKVYRLHGKVFFNKHRWVDLVTGETGEELRYGDWCGRDMARRCHDEEDLFLDLWLDDEREQYLGLKPAALSD